ncbi:MAG: vWA domain-containing protein [Actinomycetota bacterium]
MNFELPALLVGLLAVPLLALAYALFERRRAQAAAAFAAPHMAANVVPSPPRWRRHVPAALLLLALAVLLLGMARPGRTQIVTRTGGTIMLVIDASRSMNLTDISPSRLEAARNASRVLVDQLPESYKVGVVAFSGQARTLSAPTSDRDAIALALESLETRFKTVLGDGIMAGLANVPEGGDAVQLVVLSDGNDTSSEVQPLVAADEAAALDVKVNTVVVGTTGDDKGADVNTLQQIAELTDGRFFSAPSADELEGIYRDIGRRASRTTERVELTQVFVGGGLLLMVAAAGLSAWWFRRTL